MLKECKSVGPNLKTYFYYTNELAGSSEAKATVVIATGIEGTGSIYEEVGDYLASKGYAMYAMDESGYGKSANLIKGYYKNWKRKSFYYAAYQLHAMCSLAKSENPGKELYLVGNDFGAMISLYGEREFPELIDRIVTIGFGKPRLKEYHLAIKSFFRKLFFYDAGTTKSGAKAENSGLWFRFESSSKYAWLTSDKDQLKKIVDAGHVTKPGTVGHYFYYDVNKIRVATTMRLKKFNRDMPILIVSGNEDVSTYNGLTAKTLARHLQHKKCKNAEALIVDGRHQLLFETNRNEIIDRIVNWFEGVEVNLVSEEEKESVAETNEALVTTEEKVVIQEDAAVIDAKEVNEEPQKNSSKKEITIFEEAE